jgi:hypothetical protein
MFKSPCRTPTLQLVHDQAVGAGISRATRIVWDGRDGHGQAAVAGRAVFTATAMVGGRRARPLTASVLVTGAPAAQE